MGDWIKLDKNNRDTYPRFYKNDDWRGGWETDRVLCAIKAPLKNGEVRYLVKEGKGFTHEVGLDGKPADLEYSGWLIPGSQSNVVAWMPLPKYPPMDDGKEDSAEKEG